MIDAFALQCANAIWQKESGDKSKDTQRRTLKQLHAKTGVNEETGVFDKTETKDTDTHGHEDIGTLM